MDDASAAVEVSEPSGQGRSEQLHHPSLTK